MKATLPPGLSTAQFGEAMKALRGVLGAEWVLATDEDRDAYVDAYAFGNAAEHAPSATVGPASVEEVQAVLRIANEHRLPLWPISRGRNYGYGGAAPRMAGTIVLDLGRMRRILDVDVRAATALVEPGVGFYDLHQHLSDQKLPLWGSVPGNGLGSVLGNALEYGLGYGPQGNRAGSVCGMEAVLPDGALIRTGMGAMRGNPAWNLYKYSYGPSLDGLFMQSGLGIVTKANIWLMPEPESVLDLTMEVPNEEDIGWVVEALAPLRMTGVVNAPVNIGNFMRIAMGGSQREEWYDGPGALPEEALARIRAKLKLGWWGVHVMLSGDPGLVEAQAGIVRRAFAAHTTQPFESKWWHRGEARPSVPAYGVPISFPLRIANWAGPNGGHLGFSPILPPTREAVLGNLKRSRSLFRQHGFDYYGGITLGERHINAVNMLPYAKDDPNQVRRVDVLFKALMEDARAHGFAEYRSHLAYMDPVAETYDYNGHALMRAQERLKDALDPNGILAPGKQGVWPRRYRQHRV